MAKLRVLFIGGSGVISSACSRVAADSGDGAPGACAVGTDASLDAVMDKLASAWTL